MTPKQAKKVPLDSSQFHEIHPTQVFTTVRSQKSRPLSIMYQLAIEALHYKARNQISGQPLCKSGEQKREKQPQERETDHSEHWI